MTKFAKLYDKNCAILKILNALVGNQTRINNGNIAIVLDVYATIGGK